MSKYSIDRQSKNDFTATTYNYITTHYPCWTGITFYETNNNNELVPYGDPSVPENEHLDVYIDLRSKNTHIIYACELKERWGDYVSTYYGKDGQEKGWMYNPEKKRWLEDQIDNGYIPLYVNLYPDQKIRIWNILNIEVGEAREFDVPNSTVEPEKGRAKKKRYELWNNQGIIIDRIKG